jgi:hypothetical protein
MRIIGCDLQARQQTLAMLDSTTGEIASITLKHESDTETQLAGHHGRAAQSAEGVKARTALLDEYRKASPSPGFEPLLNAAIERTRTTFKIML